MKCKEPLGISEGLMCRDCINDRDLSDLQDLRSALENLIAESREVPALTEHVKSGRKDLIEINEMINELN